MKQYSLLLAACLLSVPAVVADDGITGGAGEILPLNPLDCPLAGYTQNSEEAPPIEPYVNTECIPID